MSSRTQAAIEIYKSLPGHYKVELRAAWCDRTGLGKKTLDNRLSGAFAFSPKELNVFSELVTEYHQFFEEESIEPNPEKILEQVE